MSDQEPTAAPEPIVTTRGLSERSRQLLHGTQRTDDDAAAPRNVKPHRVNRSLWWPLLYFVLVMSFADVALAPLFWGAASDWNTGPLMAVAAGLISSQVYLIALGLVFGRHSLSSRLLFTVALLLMIFVYGTAGYFGSIYTVVDEQVWHRMGGARWFAVAGMAWCYLIAVLVGLMLPLLAVRGWFGWRMTNAEEIHDRQFDPPQPGNRYSLRDLLVVMVLVSVVFAIPRATYDPVAGRYDREFFWITLSFTSLAACGLSWLMLLCLWLALESPARESPLWLGASLTYSLWGTALLMGVALCLGFRNPFGVAASVIVWMMACFCGVLIGLWVIRVHGWRIEATSRPLILPSAKTSGGPNA